ncbi:hypothetical protein B0T16DRAFT_452076 [Cercophora newfieldiana]|uniref:PhoD-like phosphatase domain-containing protein n=1 Tax=Cercophora newfieldiana TaxID=92897 RepID=A0AA39YQY3_9PEZI|nr:hypothetical protein B0T16DRAFT_452076 [Cercophora newfieldiana]
MSRRGGGPPRDPDADLFRDDDEELATPSSASTSARNPYASATKWRHQESSAFARAARQQQHQHPHPHGHPHAQQAREADSRNRVNELADFLNSSRISPSETEQQRPTTPRFIPVMAGAAEARAKSEGEGEGADHLGVPPRGPPTDGKEVVVGPLINYRRMEGSTWVGSVLVVTRGGGKGPEEGFVPNLVLRRAEPESGGTGAEVKGVCLYSDPRNTFWRFDLSAEMGRGDARWEYELPGLRYASKTKPRVNSFWVPAVTESMRIMFHSCNGFSVGTDEEAYNGAVLWKDVMRRHREAPFHVMIGGGDQIYNDAIRVSGPLRAWTDISNPKKRREYPFPEKLREECDDWYLQNYIRWYGTEPFAAANGQIPQMNIWDDHDIIDGFGSYVNEFMKCDVFRGIGGVAHKYYMIFQHHLPPPASTYTSDAIQPAPGEEGQGFDPNQSTNTYVHPRMTESNYIVGSQPGPYVVEHSHNLFTKLGARIAFLGIDARTERTRHQVNYPETYDQIFSRLREELGAAASSGSPFKHLILLLGIPIAYPRLTWLENVFSSPVLGPIKFLNRRMGLGGSFFNSFDGSVDLLDDLDDHYTARTHKKERNRLIKRLQSICAEFSVRITILGGDVHLAALGRFYSKPKLHIPVEHDYRYMVNVVSSAIVNKPPPGAVANLLSRRNKIHHLDHHTDETLFKLFDKDPGDSCKTASHNQVTMPSRNFAVITENSPNHAHNGDAHPGSLLPPRLEPPSYPAPPGSSAGRSHRSQLTRQGSHSSSSSGSSVLPGNKDSRLPIGPGEINAGTKHKAADPTDHGKGHDGSLDVCIRVEIDQSDPEGRTEGYGLTIPALDYRKPKTPEGVPPRTAGSRESTGSGHHHHH